MESRKDKAVRLFEEGYNCSQAVFGAFCDIYGIDMETALKLSCSFGGGMGRMREVCGAVSGMFMVAGLENGTFDGKDKEGKRRNYQTVQELANEFKKMNGSIICRELLGLEDKDSTDAKPEERTKEYYKKRPCVQLVADAAQILEQTLLSSKKQRIEFIPVTTKDQITELAKIANEVWHEHFTSILSLDQIDYMVDRFQSEHALTRQLQSEGYEYYFINLNGVNIGYTGVKPEEGKLFLSKLYILKQYRGNGYASEAFNFLEGMCLGLGLSSIYLTVNRFNENTIKVYERKGFITIKEQVADIGDGYVMDDYVMEKKIENNF